MTYTIRRPHTGTPLAYADTRAGALDLAGRESVERELTLQVERDGRVIAIANPWDSIDILETEDELDA